MGRSRSTPRGRRRVPGQKLPSESRRAFPGFEVDDTDELMSPRRFSAGDIISGRVTASHSAILAAAAATGEGSSTRNPSARPDLPPRGRIDENHQDSDDTDGGKEHTNKPRVSGSAEARKHVDGRQTSLGEQAARSNRVGFGVTVPSLRLPQRRRRSSWSSPRDSRRPNQDGACNGDAPARAVPVSPLLQLHWEMQGVSGRAYQNDGDPSLYRKKKMAARRRLSKNKNVRVAIERGWWLYLPLRWVALNDHHVMKILPRQGYIRLFTTMYTTLVPTAGGKEAEETASWEYGEDTRGLPLELGRAGLTLEAFSRALFSVADNWTETVLAEEYVGFLDLLWKRVRPDLLFPPPPRLEADKPPPLFSTAMTKDSKSSSRRGRRKKGKRNNLNSRARSRRPHATDTGSPSSPAARWDGVGDGGGAGGGSGDARAGGGAVKIDYYAKVGRPHPPPPRPPPSTPGGLLVLRIPGFQPRDAQRAAWVGAGGYINPEANRMLRGEGVKILQAKGVEEVKTAGEHQPQKGEEQEEQEEEPGWKQRRRRRLLRAGIVEEREGKVDSARTFVGGGGGSTDTVDEAEEVDSVWDFAAGRFPLDPGERDAFILFVERKRPRFFVSNPRQRAKDDAVNHILINEPEVPQPGGGVREPLRCSDSTSSSPHPRDFYFDIGGIAGGVQPRIVVRRYRSKEDSWARARRKSVPKRVLEDLLVAWRERSSGLTPAEYGAAFVGFSQRANFLAYAIANGWGTRAGGVHSQQTLDGVAEGWRVGSGICPEVDVLWEILEDLLWEAADDAMDQAFSDGVDLYTIPHRLLRDPPGVPQARSRSQTGLYFRREADFPPRASTAPASTAPTTRRPRTARCCEPARVRSCRNDGGQAEGTGTDLGSVSDADGVNRRPEGPGSGGGGGGTGPAGRVLLPGERVSGSVQQGQATFFKTPCPTERGACLEVTVVSAGGTGERNTTASDAEATAISLYAIQAPHRPLRLSSYQWVSRGKTYHKLILNWKGSLPCSSQISADRGHGFPGTPADASLPCAVTPSPWGGVTGHTLQNPAVVSASAFSTASAPIHIAVVCPEAPPPLAVPVAPAFDGSDLLVEAEQSEGGAHQNGTGAEVDAEADLTLEDVPRGRGKTPADAEGAKRGRGTTAERRRRRRVKFFVGVRVLGPPRVVLEGRWYSLPLGSDTGVGKHGQHLLTAYATLRLPTPLKIAGWGTEHRTGSEGTSREGRACMFVGAQGEPSFVDSQILVTLQVRPSDPNTGVDVYCGASPRPGPAPDEHTWWMLVGGGRDGGSMRPQTARGPSRRRVGGDGDGPVNKEYNMAGGGGSEAGRRPLSSARSDVENTHVFRACSQVELSRRGGSTAAGEQEERAGVVPGGIDAAAKEDSAQHASTGEAGGAGWSRMTVAMPLDHAGAFHVGVFGRTRRKTAVGVRGPTPAEAIDIKAAVWCPVVTVPPRIPLCGHLPRGQRRELLWNIGRDELVFEARVEITRAIEDPFILKQLEFAQGFQRRFCPSKDGGERVPVSGSGRACQGMHTRPFLLVSKRLSPSRHDYTWRGVNTERAVEVLHTSDETMKVFTRYTETLKVGPSDERHAAGKYRLALEAGATDCSFRLLFWNRAASAKDRVFVTVTSIPTSAAGVGEVFSTKRREGEKAEGITPAREGARGGEGEPCDTTGGLSSRRPEASAPAPSSPVHSPRNEPKADEAFTDAEPTPRVVPAALPRSPSPRVERPLVTNERVEARAAACDAAIPSAICTIAGGVAAACVSPRGKVGGCTRQLVVAGQYLNHSLIVPAPPREQTAANNDPGWRRASTAEEGTKSVRPSQGILVGRSHSINRGGRPRTSPAEPSLREVVRSHSPVAAAGSIWRSSAPGIRGDRQQGDLSRVGLSSRPLKSRKTAPVGNGGPPGRWYGSPPRRRREPVVVASPKRERSPKRCGFLSVQDGSSSPVTRDLTVAAPADAAEREHNTVAPVCGNGGPLDVEMVGEVGYTISSAAALGGNTCCTESRRDGTGSRVSRRPQEKSARSEPFLGSATYDTAGEQYSAAAATTIPKLKLDLLE